VCFVVNCAHEDHKKHRNAFACRLFDY
jgi:hypothetical protein